MKVRDILLESQLDENVLAEGDDFDIEINEEESLNTFVSQVTEGGIYLYADAGMLEALAAEGLLGEELSDEAHELMLYAENDQDLYRQSYIPIVKNLEKKFAKGTYDPELAKKLWKYHADRAAVKYGTEHGNGDGLKIFSPSVRREVAAELQAHHYAEMEAGNFHEAKDMGISKDDETEFHSELDTLVHNTFGKRKDEAKYQADGQTDEGIGQMSHDKLRFHATVPHGRYTNAEIRDEIKRRKKTGEYNSNYKAESDEIDEAKYQGREVPLGKPMKGDVKKSKVYVRKPNGKVVKVNFGDPNMRIKKTSPKHRKSFRARHHCQNPGPRWKARYWSCRAW